MFRKTAGGSVFQFLLAAIIIMGLVLFFIPKYKFYKKDSTLKKVESDFLNISNAVESFYADIGGFPDEIGENKDPGLLQNPCNYHDWNGSYLGFWPEAPGNSKYRYIKRPIVKENNSGVWVCLVYYGFDGKLSQDILNLNPSEFQVHQLIQKGDDYLFTIANIPSYDWEQEKKIRKIGDEPNVQLEPVKPLDELSGNIPGKTDDETILENKVIHQDSTGIVKAKHP